MRRLIGKVEAGLNPVNAAERQQTEQAVTLVRRHLTIALGMPRIRQPLSDIRPQRS